MPASTTLLTFPDGAEIHFSWPRPTDNAARAGDVTYRAMRDGETIAWFSTLRNVAAFVRHHDDTDSHRAPAGAIPRRRVPVTPDGRFHLCPRPDESFDKVQLAARRRTAADRRA